MLREMRACLLVALLALAASTSAYTWHVPEERQTIMAAVGDASDGDTISVWVHTVPPDTYYENVDYLGKSLFIVNRSFLPGQVPYDSSWDHVAIDGQQLATTVTIVLPNGAPEATLKGFTITGGLTYGNGGGISCVAGQVAIIKNLLRGNLGTLPRFLG